MLGSRTWLHRMIEFAILRQTQLDRPTVATVGYVLQRAFASTASLGVPLWYVTLLIAVFNTT